jgi:hypothetical protein
VINLDNYHYSVVIDGRTFPADNGVESVTFSPDGRRFALVTSYLERQPECFYRVYLDGALSGPELCMPSILWEMEDEYVGWDQPEREYPPPPEPRFSADSKHVVWVGYADDWLESMIAVLDGRVGPVCRRIRNLFFTSGGHAVWKAVLEDDAQTVVVDLEPSGVWDRVSSPVELLYDRVAFWARRNDGHWLVVGDKKWGPYDGVAKRTMCEALDSSIAFVATRKVAPVTAADGTDNDTREESMIPVVNGRQGPACRQVRNVFFTSDDQPVWEAVLENGAEVVVVGFESSKEWEKVALAHELASGRLAFWARREGKWWLIIADDTLGPFDHLLNECYALTDRAQAMGAVVLRGAWTERRAGECGWTLDSNGDFQDYGEEMSYDPYTERGVVVDSNSSPDDDDGPPECSHASWWVMGPDPGGEWFAVAKGQVFGPYQGIGEDTLGVGLDGTVSFAARRNGRYLLVRGGLELAEYDWIEPHWRECARASQWDHERGGGLLMDGSVVFIAQHAGQRLRVVVTEIAVP